MTQSELEALTYNNVVDVTFMRRRPVKGKSAMRRMLCTKNNDILYSVNGKLTLHYQAPHTFPKYDPNEKNLVIVWDILMQDFRAIPCEGISVLNTYTPDDFWPLFNEKFFTMSASQKLLFMESSND